VVVRLGRALVAWVVQDAVHPYVAADIPFGVIAAAGDTVGSVVTGATRTEHS
jgi:hypothetical protein